MSIVQDGSGVPKALVERVKGILLRPNSEWDVIDVEPATAKGLFTGYACILAAIPVVCGVIGGQLLGHSFLGVTVRPPLVTSIVGAVLGYVLSLVMVFVIGLIIDALAPTFDGQKNQIQALKVAVYSYTASWVAGVLALVPPLMPLGILAGLYGLYLLYLGLPKLMKAPQEKAVLYTLVTIVVAVVLSIVVGACVAAVAGMGALTTGGLASIAGHSDDAKISGSIGVPGVGSVDLGKLQEASKQMEAAAKQAQSGGAVTVDGKTVQPIPAETLQAMLPGSVAGYARGDVSSQSGGAGGISGSSAEGRYAKGEANFTLQVTDLGSMAGLAALGGAFNVNSTKNTSTGYEKVGKVNGRMTTEEWDSQSKSGKFGVMVADRFMVEADGNGANMDELKGAVTAVDFGKLESLAKG
jgi:hypothetical protein